MPFGPRLDTNDWTLRLDTKVGMPFFWDPGWTLKLECLLGPGLDTKVGHKSTNNLYVFKLLAFGAPDWTRKLDTKVGMDFWTQVTN